MEVKKTIKKKVSFVPYISAVHSSKYRSAIRKKSPRRENIREHDAICYSLEAMSIVSDSEENNSGVVHMDLNDSI